MPKKTIGKKEPKKNVKAPSKRISQEEFEKKVIELADKGLTSEKIGETLRREKIHPNDYDKKISKILKEKDKYTIPNVVNLEKKLERIKNHREKNKQDKRAMRERDRIASKLRRIKKYHKII